MTTKSMEFRYREDADKRQRYTTGNSTVVAAQSARLEWRLLPKGKRTVRSLVATLKCSIDSSHYLYSSKQPFEVSCCRRYPKIVVEQ